MQAQGGGKLAAARAHREKGLVLLQRERERLAAKRRQQLAAQVCRSSSQLLCSMPSNRTLVTTSWQLCAPSSNAARMHGALGCLHTLQSCCRLAA